MEQLLAHSDITYISNSYSKLRSLCSVSCVLIEIMEK
jgi:hypothetical protein